MTRKRNDPVRSLRARTQQPFERRALQQFCRSSASALPQVGTSATLARHQLSTSSSRQCGRGSAEGARRRGRRGRPTALSRPISATPPAPHLSARLAGPGVALLTKAYSPAGWAGPRSSVARAREARHRRRGRGCAHKASGGAGRETAGAGCAATQMSTHGRASPQRSDEPKARTGSGLGALPGRAGVVEPDSTPPPPPINAY